MRPPVPTRAALLQALRSGGPSWGSDLIERVKKLTRGKLVLHQGGVYPTLQALEEEHLIEVLKDEPGPNAGRPRRYYRLTQQGTALALTHQSIMQQLFKESP
jgi:DNA-binding PadR family transcriptional regulator